MRYFHSLVQASITMLAILKSVWLASCVPIGSTGLLLRRTFYWVVDFEAVSSGGSDLPVAVAVGERQGRKTQVDHLDGHRGRYHHLLPGYSN